jgi:hypothetical protein
MNDSFTDSEKLKTFTNLDFRIDQKEIKEAICKLKNKKAVGLDCIANEMMKTGYQVLMPCIQKMFNTILSSGKYPNLWKVGYIKPLHKSDSPNNPQIIEEFSLCHASRRLLIVF